MTKNIKFKDWRTKKLQDPKYRAESIKQEPAYQVARLRMLKGLTQAELAKIVGTKQSSIARLESGKVQPRLSFLRRVVKALDGYIDLNIMTREEAEEAERAAGKSRSIVITNVVFVEIDDNQDKEVYEIFKISNPALPSYSEVAIL